MNNISHRRLPRFLVALFACLSLATTGCSKWSAERTIKSYLNQEVCSNRAQFILDPEANKEALASHYKDTKDCKRTFTEIKAEDCAKVEVGSTCDAKVTFDQNDSQWYLLKKTTDGFKIDWRASLPYNPVSMVALKTRPMSAPAIFRANIKLDTSGMGRIKGLDDSLVFSMWVGNKQVWSNVPRASKEGVVLFSITQDGEPHAVMLELSDMGNEGGLERVHVNRFVQKGWATTPEEFTPAKPAP